MSHSAFFCYCWENNHHFNCTYSRAHDIRHCASHVCTFFQPIINWGVQPVHFTHLSQIHTLKPQFLTRSIFENYEVNFLTWFSQNWQRESQFRRGICLLLCLKIGSLAFGGDSKSEKWENMILVISLPILIYTGRENLQWLSIIYSTQAIHS